MTKHLRAGSNKLFIFYKKNQHNPASKDSISKWIVNTIKIAYTDTSLEGVRAHDVRSFPSSWALFQGTPIQDIMEADFLEIREYFYTFLHERYVQKSFLWKSCDGSCSLRITLRGKLFLIFLSIYKIFSFWLGT